MVGAHIFFFTPSPFSQENVRVPNPPPRGEICTRTFCVVCQINPRLVGHNDCWIHFKPLSMRALLRMWRGGISPMVLFGYRIQIENQLISLETVPAQ